MYDSQSIFVYIYAILPFAFTLYYGRQEIQIIFSKNSSKSWYKLDFIAMFNNISAFNKNTFPVSQHLERESSHHMKKA